MKVFVDYHHGNLLYSLYLLFEKRLGFELYRPIGLDWASQGWWKVHEPYGWAQDTANQYLGLDGREWIHVDEMNINMLNLNYNSWKEGEIYRIRDMENNFVHRAVTLETFRNMKFDLIIASFPTHTNWVDLLQLQPQAKFIMQIGNEGQTSDADNILCSTADFVAKPYQNVMRYHQEFDLTDYFYQTPPNHNKINSFVVSLPEPLTYEMYKGMLPEFDFHAYGVGSPDGTISGSTIPARMRDSAFGWHIKPSDGYGHVIHKWFASGRPVITKASYYKGKMAEPLLIDGETCIDLDKRSFEDNLTFIKEMAKPENHLRMCKNAFKKFNEVVDFDMESIEIKNWLNNLI
jgi:hypothetical protein